MSIIEVHIEIELIEKHYVNGNHREAYEALYAFCKNGYFSSEATSILARFNDLEKSRFEGLLEPSQHLLQKREIGKLCTDLIKIMRKHFDINSDLNSYEEQAVRMEEHNFLLNKTLRKTEDDWLACPRHCSQKKDILEQIMKDINAAMDYFVKVITKFRSIKNYE